MLMRVLEFLVVVLRPLFVVVGFIFRMIWRVFFGWWLGPLLDRHFQKQLQDDIRTHIPFLFLEHGAVFVPVALKDRYSTQAVVQLKDFRIMFSYFRDQYDVLVASNDRPDIFQEITAFLDNQDFQEGRRRNPGVPYSYSSWSGAGWILEQNWNRLTKALSS